jgi:hypothetical protein
MFIIGVWCDAASGKPLKAVRNEVQYGADFLLWYAV